MLEIDPVAAKVFRRLEAIPFIVHGELMYW